MVLPKQIHQQSEVPSSACIKMYKLVKDPCYGLYFEQKDHCCKCWIKNACAVSYRSYVRNGKKK